MPKSKYESHVAPYLDKIKLWAEKGATQDEIAKKLHIAVSTFKLYLSRGDKGEEPYSDLTACFKCACEVANDEVEASLFKRAKGYQYLEVTKEEKLDRMGNVVVLTKQVVKEVPPDPSSAMFWLANRRPSKWQYKPEADKDKGKDDSEQGVIMIPEVSADG